MKSQTEIGILKNEISRLTIQNRELREAHLKVVKDLSFLQDAHLKLNREFLKIK